MKFSDKTITQPIEILANDHFVAVPYDCSNLTAADSGIIAAGTVVPSNDAGAVGILLSDVDKENNPNGTIVIHGFIKSSKLPVAATTNAIAALKQINFV